jgi:cytochrome o ubiquinol oxidase operon protein cyoD
MNEHNITLKNYLLGLGLSFILVLAAYVVVIHSSLPKSIILLLAIALLQVLIQLKFFLHLTFGKSSRLNVATLIFTGSGIFVLVVGSLWIMYHLNYRMSSSEMSNYLIQDEGIGR